MSDDEILTFEEHVERRSDSLLGRDKPRRGDDMTAAYKFIRDGERDPTATVDDYVEESYPQNRPQFRGHRQADEALKQEAAQRAEDQRIQRQADEKRAAEQERREIRQAGQWQDNERPVLTELDQRSRALQNAELEWSQFDASGWSQEQKQAVEGWLREERSVLENAGKVAQYTAQQKKLQGAMRQLPEGLRNNKTERERLAKWLEGKGFTRADVEAEQNPSVIKRAYKQMKAEQKEQAAKEKRERVASLARRHGTRRGNEAPPESSTEAKQRLRESGGSVRDATRILTLERLERTL